MGWQLIETAPKVGSIWAARPYVGHGSGEMEPVRRLGRLGIAWVNIYTDERIKWIPTHWMPFPDPPQEITK